MRSMGILSSIQPPSNLEGSPASSASGDCPCFLSHSANLPHSGGDRGLGSPGAGFEKCAVSSKTAWAVCVSMLNRLWMSHNHFGAFCDRSQDRLRLGPRRGPGPDRFALHPALAGRVGPFTRTPASRPSPG
jgi:hypothetical protein